MREVAFVVPGDIDTVSGGYGYDRRLIAELPGQGWAARHVALAGDYPLVSKADAEAAARVFETLGDGASVLVDGLALAVLPEVVADHAGRLSIVGLVHHPLCLETGLDPHTAARLEASERRALEACRRVVVTSPETRRILESDFGVTPEKLSVALPGTEPAPLAKGGNVPPHLVSVASLIPRKGHDVLIEALATLRHLDWRLTIAGSDTADPAWAAELRDSVARLGLGERIVFLGPLKSARDLMATGDVFVLPSRYEGYGMAFAEAMAQGLPVVACAGGAVPDVVPDTAGLLVPVGDDAALAEALSAILSDDGLRRRLSAGALQAGAALPRWSHTAAVVAAALEGCAP